MAMTTYDFVTAEAVCNDAQKNTWHVQITGSDGLKYVVSESAEMTKRDAELLAKSMRED